MGLDRRSLLVLATAIAVAAAILLAPIGPGPAIVARLTADEPDGQLALFAGAIRSGDLARARSLWVIPANASGVVRDGLEERQHEIMAELARFAGAPYAVERVQWWANCCMPSVIPSRHGAGGARYWVRFDGSSTPYVVDIFAIDTSWLYDGQPARGWAVRDVYPEGERPLYFRWSEN
jgi:hypothetical protein